MNEIGQVGPRHRAESHDVLGEQVGAVISQWHVVDARADERHRQARAIGQRDGDHEAANLVDVGGMHVARVGDQGMICGDAQPSPHHLGGGRPRRGEDRIESG